MAKSSASRSRPRESRVVTPARARTRTAPASALVGTAGWSLPRPTRAAFPETGTLLQRYATVLPVAEINSSFYRPHRPATYERWAASVPETFRFSVKVPRTITHECRLVDVGDLLDEFLGEATALGDRLGCLLVQLPPSLAFDAKIAGAFLGALRQRHAGPVAIEPRHASWFTPSVEKLLVRRAVARVGADPARVPEAALTGGHRELAYLRLHGSPRIYYSNYEDAWLDALAERLDLLSRESGAVWCIFDNTVLGAAMANALGVVERLAAATSTRKRANPRIR